MDKKKQIGILFGVVVVLLAATAVGIVIMSIQSQWYGAEGPKPEVEVKESKPVAAAVAEDENATNSTDDNEAFLRWIYENTSEEEEAEPVVEEEPKTEPVAAAVREEASPFEQQGRGPGGFGGWGNMWGDLNLTPEQQERIREAMRLGWERWQNMSDEERQAQMDKMREGFERWQNMSDEEREDAMQQMRKKFEDWLDSDEAEFPDFSLD